MFGIDPTADLQQSVEHLCHPTYPYDIIGDTAQLFHSNDDNDIRLRQSHNYDPTFEVRRTTQQASSQMIKTFDYSDNVTPKLCTHDLDLARNLGCSPFCTNTTMDQVLMANNSAIEHARALLECPCSESSGIALSFALIKLLETYEDVIKVTAATCNSPAITHRPSGSSIDMTDGNCKMAAEYEERLRVHIIFRDLLKMRELVDIHATKYSHRDKVGNVGHGIYVALEEFLRLRLTATFQMLLGKLEG